MADIKANAFRFRIGRQPRTELYMKRAEKWPQVKATPFKDMRKWGMAVEP